MPIWRGRRLEHVPVPSAIPAFKELSGCLWGRAPQKSISHSRKLFELCNVCCIIVRKGMCTVCVCSRECGGVVWVDCISFCLYLLFTLHSNLMMFQHVDMIHAHSSCHWLLAWIISSKHSRSVSNLFSLCVIWKEKERNEERGSKQKETERRIVGEGVVRHFKEKAFSCSSSF